MKSTPTIFIVDDDPDVADSIVVNLRLFEMNTAVFTSASEFLDSYKSGSPGCLLLDAWMPEMNGFELLSALRERRVTLPAIMISGDADLAHAVDPLSNGVFAFLEKPFRMSILRQHILRAVAFNIEPRKIVFLRQDANTQIASQTLKT